MHWTSHDAENLTELWIQALQAQLWRRSKFFCLILMASVSCFHVECVVRARAHSARFIWFTVFLLTITHSRQTASWIFLSVSLDCSTCLKVSVGQTHSLFTSFSQTFHWDNYLYWYTVLVSWVLCLPHSMLLNPGVKTISNTGLLILQVK